MRDTDQRAMTPGGGAGRYRSASVAARLRAGAASIALVGALLALLASGLRVPAERAVDQLLSAFDVPPEPPTPTPAPEATANTATRPAGAAAPPNRTATPAPVVAPPPIVPVPAPPVIAAPVAGAGSAPDAGAAPLAGPGTGAGGVGSGSGSGSGGGGTGGGGGGGGKPQRLRGGIAATDYPSAARRAEMTGTVILTLSIDSAGRVAGCSVAVSSGHPLLDATTCRLATARFRYRPAYDGAGRAVAGLAGWRQDWWLENGRPAPLPTR